jgi:hypothetical protein
MTLRNIPDGKDELIIVQGNRKLFSNSATCEADISNGSGT